MTLLLDLAAAAASLGVSARTVHREIVAGLVVGTLVAAVGDDNLTAALMACTACLISAAITLVEEAK